MNSISGACVALCLNSEWVDVNLDADFLPWSKEDRWMNLSFFHVGKGRDFVTPKGNHYGFTSDSEEPNTPLQLLRVRWLNGSGRSVFGYCVRVRETEEIVAIVHQGGGWAWWFKIKNENSAYALARKDRGWVYENLLQNTLNSVCYYLLETDNDQ